MSGLIQGQGFLAVTRGYIRSTDLGVIQVTNNNVRYDNTYLVMRENSLFRCVANHTLLQWFCHLDDGWHSFTRLGFWQEM